MDSYIVFHKKQNGHRNLVKFKMCIVTKDFSQISKEDFMDIFSFVTKFFTLWIFLAYVTYLDWDLYYVDIVTAYLHGSFDKKIYITIPDGIEHSESSHY